MMLREEPLHPKPWDQGHLCGTVYHLEHVASTTGSIAEHVSIR